MISVILPVYNCAQFIGTSIKSILNQTFKDFELIIINDGSTDSAEETVKRFKDPRIKYYKKQHSGLPDTLNYALKKCTHELVARMDSDDISLPERFEKQLSLLKCYPQFDIISCWYAVFSGNSINYIVKTSADSKKITERLSLHSEIIHAGALYKKSSILKIGGYDSNCSVFEDYDLWLRGKSKLKFSNVQEVLLFLRERKNSLSRENIQQKYKIHYDIQEQYYQDKNLTAFYIINEELELKYRGWREYFYGNKRIARFHWNKLKHKIVFDPRLVMAFLLTYLPDKYLVQFKEYRMKFRFEYLFTRYTKKNIMLRKLFNKLVQ